MSGGSNSSQPGWLSTEPDSSSLSTFFSNSLSITEATVEEAVKAGIAVEAVEIKAMDKKKCTIELAPVNLGTIESFRDNVEKYFSDKKDIIDNVIACAVNNAGRSVRLESAVKRQLWMNFFNQPEEKYGDLIGVKTVLHCCKDLVNCDRRLA